LTPRLSASISSASVDAGSHPPRKKSAISSDNEIAACFLEAMNVARRQNARLWELRAATSLARLWRNQGKRTEAHELLAPIYGWFTEGFETLDLKEAKLLLDQLSA
jgi:predicted ATPase